MAGDEQRTVFPVFEVISFAHVITPAGNNLPAVYYDYGTGSGRTPSHQVKYSMPGDYRVSVFVEDEVMHSVSCHEVHLEDLVFQTSL